MQPTAEVAAVVHEFRGMPVRLLFSTPLGLSSARNAALSAAEAEYVAFLDDDAVVEVGWLAAVLDGCRQYAPEICGGPSYPLFRQPRPPWYDEVNGSYALYGSAVRRLRPNEWLGGMNFVVRRSTAIELGGFRTDLGMAGHKVAYGEETALMRDLWAHDPSARICYLPGAAVRHEVRPEKMTVAWNAHSALAGGRDGAAMGLLDTSLLVAIRFLLASGGRLAIEAIIIGAIALSRGLIDGGVAWRRRFMRVGKNQLYWTAYWWAAVRARVMPSERG